MAAVRVEPPERGAATVLAMAFLGLIVLVGAALAVVGVLVVDHRRAQSAADLAALAGAEAAAQGGEPCSAAGTVAGANDAVLTACTTAGGDITVEVQVTGPRWLGQTHDLAAKARAGPASTQY